MKLQLDTDAKTIKIEGDVNTKELFDKLEKLLPGEWQNYKLQTNTIIQNFTSPIVIDRWRPYSQPFWYSQSPSVDYNNRLLTNHNTSNQVYNIEC